MHVSVFHGFRRVHKLRCCALVSEIFRRSGFECDIGKRPNSPTWCCHLDRPPQVTVIGPSGLTARPNFSRAAIQHNQQSTPSAQWLGLEVSTRKSVPPTHGFLTAVEGRAQYLWLWRDFTFSEFCPIMFMFMCVVLCICVSLYLCIFATVCQGHCRDFWLSSYLSNEVSRRRSSWEPDNCFLFSDNKIDCNVEFFKTQ